MNVKFWGIDTLSERYRSLVEEVILRLPHDWAGTKGGAKCTTFKESDAEPLRLTGLAQTQYPKRQPVFHTVILYRRNLDGCSDETVRWVVAHELGHVAMSHLSRFVDEEKGEDYADSLAMGWGFGEEWKAWSHWNEFVFALAHFGIPCRNFASLIQ